MGPIPASSRRACFRSMLSVLALAAGVAALGCSLAALISAAWVDTREPVYLSHADDWTAVFGSGYGSVGLFSNFLHFY